MDDLGILQTVLWYQTLCHQWSDDGEEAAPEAGDTGLEKRPISMSSRRLARRKRGSVAIPGHYALPSLVSD